MAIFLSVAVYTVALIGFSPELRKQSLLPAYPLLILFAWLSVADFLRQRQPGAFATAGLAVRGLALFTLMVEGRLWEDGLYDHRELLKDTLKLTRPGDFVMDRKGETIFRRRPVYLVYQHATVRAIEEGRLADPDPADTERNGNGDCYRGIHGADRSDGKIHREELYARRRRQIAGGRPEPSLLRRRRPACGEGSDLYSRRVRGARR